MSKDLSRDLEYRLEMQQSMLLTDHNGTTDEERKYRTLDELEAFSHVRLNVAKANELKSRATLEATAAFLVWFFIIAVVGWAIAGLVGLI